MYAIRTERLTKKYKDLTAVDNLDLVIEQGELFALLGVNGAGKTTTIKMLTCLTKPDSGNAFINGSSTAIGQCIGGIIPILYFVKDNPSPLKLTKTKFHAKPLIDACINGASELLSNITMPLVGMLYNMQLLKYAGEDGVAAYGVLMYVNMIFIAVFIGYSIGMAPIVSYHYGANNYAELKSLRKKSLVIIGIASVVMFVLAEVLARPLAMIFSSYDQALLDMTVRAFFIYSFAFLFSGVGIWSSSFFTALNNGLVSAIISFLRSLVFQVAAVFILPLIFDLDGIWLSVLVADCLTAIVGIIYLVSLRKQYKY